MGLTRAPTISIADAEVSRTAVLATAGDPPPGRAVPFLAGDDFACLGGVRPPFAMPNELRVSTLEDAYLLVGPGRDGIVHDRHGRLIAETRHFAHASEDELDPTLFAPGAIEIDQPLVVTLDASWRNYYHWLLIGLGRAILYDRHCDHGHAMALFDHDERKRCWPIGFSKEVWAQGLARSGIGADTKTLMTGAYRVRRLDVVWMTIDQPPFIALFPRLYAGFRAIAADIPIPRRRKIIVARPHDGRLDDTAKAALDSLARLAGFEYLVLETLSFEEQVAAFAAADTIVSPHGAGLANLVYAPPTATVVELGKRLLGEECLRPWFYLVASQAGQAYSLLDTDRYEGDAGAIHDRIVELSALSPCPAVAGKRHAP